MKFGNLSGNLAPCSCLVMDIGAKNLLDCVMVITFWIWNWLLLFLVWIVNCLDMELVIIVSSLNCCELVIIVSVWTYCMWNLGEEKNNQNFRLSIDIVVMDGRGCTIITGICGLSKKFQLSGCCFGVTIAVMNREGKVYGLHFGLGINNLKTLFLLNRHLSWVESWFITKLN